jgi:hypothetical protein
MRVDWPQARVYQCTMKNVKMNNWVQKSDGKCLDAICLLLELFLPHLPVVGGITAAKAGRFFCRAGDAMFRHHSDARCTMRG